MVEKAVEVLCETSNVVVLKMTGRHYPGLVVQGDTLFELYQCAANILRLAESCDNQAIEDAAGELFDELRTKVLHYQKTLEDNGLSLPFEQVANDESID